eukprot:563149-Prymnesium_polylepis.1
MLYVTCASNTTDGAAARRRRARDVWEASVVTWPSSPVSDETRRSERWVVDGMRGGWLGRGARAVTGWEARARIGDGDGVGGWGTVMAGGAR